MIIMKTYKKALLLLSFGMTLNSCLDLDPQDQLADGNLWGSASDFEYFANNFYGWTLSLIHISEPTRP